MKISNWLLAASVGAIAFSACNSGDTKTNGSDTTVAVTPSSPVVVDSSAIKADSAAMAAKDTTLSTANASSPSKSSRAPVRRARRGRIVIKWDRAHANDAIAMDKEGVYNRAEVAPSFPGGESALSKYIQDNIQYPDEAVNGERQGTVYVAFTVDENGKVTRANTNTKMGYGLENEAVRVVSNMPRWNPGKVNGKNVKTRFTIPITYQLEDNQ